MKTEVHPPLFLQEQLLTLLQQGEEPAVIHRSIVKAACEMPDITGAALFLPPDRQQREPSFTAASGIWEKSCPISSQLFETCCPAPFGGIQEKDGLLIADILCLGAPIGMLVAEAVNSGQEVKSQLRFLATLAGTVFERQNLSSTVQHLLDRLEVLSELNQLVASNASLPRIINIVCRESCFRFSADIALTYIFRDQARVLGLRGGYGCPQNSVPLRLEADSPLVKSIIQAGAKTSFIQLAPELDSEDFSVFQKLGVKLIMACCLEVRNEISGVVFLGYSVPLSFSRADQTRFEEFAKAASVAIDNAKIHDQLKAYTERLEDIVHERTRELEIQTRRAEEANTAKSRFLANMSHELRTPLTAIIGYSSILDEGVFGDLNNRQVDAIKAISRSGDHLKRLIDDVLNLARVESGKEDVRAEEIDIRDSLLQVYKMMMQTAIDKDVALSVPLYEDRKLEYLLFIDPKHFRQIILNLLSNAIKYTPSGGSVSINVAAHGKAVSIEIQDTGVGMTAEELDRLWERFMRGDDAYSRAQEGTGIGLHLTRRLVELNNGTVDVRSEHGKGSVFTVQFPFHIKENVEVIIDQTPAGSLELHGVRAVIVDDNEDTLAVLRHILIDRGAEVEIFPAVQEAFKSIERSAPDIILTDLAMSGESGLDLLVRLRKMEEPFASLPVVVLSACAFDRDRQAVMDAGANLFIAKPFRAAEVIQAVAEVTLYKNERVC